MLISSFYFVYLISMTAVINRFAANHLMQAIWYYKNPDETWPSQTHRAYQALVSLVILLGMYPFTKQKDFQNFKWLSNLIFFLNILMIVIYVSQNVATQVTLNNLYNQNH